MEGERKSFKNICLRTSHYFVFLNFWICWFLYLKPESRPTISVRRRAGICANNSWKWKEFTKDWEKKKMSRRDDEKWTRFRAPGASSLQTWRLNLEERRTKNDFQRAKHKSIKVPKSDQKWILYKFTKLSQNLLLHYLGSGGSLCCTRPSWSTNIRHI